MAVRRTVEDEFASVGEPLRIAIRSRRRQDHPLSRAHRAARELDITSDQKGSSDDRGRSATESAAYCCGALSSRAYRLAQVVDGSPLGTAMWVMSPQNGGEQTDWAAATSPILAHVSPESGRQQLQD